MPTDKVVEDKYLTEIKVFLKNKYGKICEGEEFVNCYNDILDFIKSKKKKAYDYMANVFYEDTTKENKEDKEKKNNKPIFTKIIDKIRGDK